MTRDCWNTFAVSGKVKDYLKYREQEHLIKERTQMLSAADGVEHGANSCPDRHGAVGNACR